LSYGVEFSRQAAKVLKRLDRTTISRVRERLEQVAHDPYERRITEGLEMVPGQRYTRVGDWPIILEVQESDKSVYIVTIQHRSRVYKDLKK
jgi:mRNA interferase RelE/StbE